MSQKDLEAKLEKERQKIDSRLRELNKAAAEENDEEETAEKKEEDTEMELAVMPENPPPTHKSTAGLSKPPKPGNKPALYKPDPLTPQEKKELQGLAPAPAAKRHFPWKLIGKMPGQKKPEKLTVASPTAEEAGGADAKIPIKLTGRTPIPMKPNERFADIAVQLAVNTKEEWAKQQLEKELENAGNPAPLHDFLTITGKESTLPVVPDEPPISAIPPPPPNAPPNPNTVTSLSTVPIPPPPPSHPPNVDPDTAAEMKLLGIEPDSQSTPHIPLPPPPTVPAQRKLDPASMVTSSTTELYSVFFNDKDKESKQSVPSSTLPTSIPSNLSDIPPPGPPSHPPPPQVVHSTAVQSVPLPDSSSGNATNSSDRNPQSIAAKEGASASLVQSSTEVIRALCYC